MNAGGGVQEDVGEQRSGNYNGEISERVVQTPKFPGSSCRLKAAKPTKGRTVWEALVAGRELVGKNI